VNSSDTLAAMIDLAREMGLTLRRAPSAVGESEHPGGAVVRLRGEPIIFLNPVATPAEQLDVLVSALRDCPRLEGRFLRPDLRELLESDEQG
jgi:hypothetical protein